MRNNVVVLHFAVYVATITWLGSSSETVQLNFLARLIATRWKIIASQRSGEWWQDLVPVTTSLSEAPLTGFHQGSRLGMPTSTALEFVHANHTWCLWYLVQSFSIHLMHRKNIGKHIIKWHKNQKTGGLPTWKSQLQHLGSTLRSSVSWSYPRLPSSAVPSRSAKALVESQTPLPWYVWEWQHKKENQEEHGNMLSPTSLLLFWNIALKICKLF